MKIEPLLEGNYYHIYNRGINGENIFDGKSDYENFLMKYPIYLDKIIETLAYCLLGNHFHLLAYINENIFETRRDGSGDVRLNASKQLGHFFNAYAQKFNYNHSRTGSLFESPFHRKRVTNNDYLTAVILYIHGNPQHHGFVRNFASWPYSSYHAIVNNEVTFVNTRWILDWFGGRDLFIKAHDQYRCVPGNESWMIEP